MSEECLGETTQAIKSVRPKRVWGMKINSLNFELDGRVAILGIGSESRGDDAAGIRVVEKIQEKIDSPHILVIVAGPVPESFTSKIKKFEPDYIMLIDSVDSEEHPGKISVIDPNRIVGEKLSSHRLPLSMMMEYLKEETGAEVILVGIQPNRVKMGSKMSGPVKKSVDNLAKILKEKLR